MASAAYRNTLTLLAIVESNILFIERIYKARARNKTVLGMTAKTVPLVKEASELWTGYVDQRDVDRIHARLKSFLDTYLPVGRELDVTVLTSLNLALLEWLYDQLSDFNRKRAIQLLIERTFRLHRYFDRKLDKFAQYRDGAYRADGFLRMAA